MGRISRPGLVAKGLAGPLVRILPEIGQRDHVGVAKL
jgi:hypothetical protein